MNILSPFEKGVLGVLSCSWSLVLQTPLVIRGSKKVAFKQQKKDENKGRGTDLDLIWKDADQILDDKQKGYSETADFNYHFYVQQDKVEVAYNIPASSIRGALRNAAIKSLVDIDNRELFTIFKKDDSDQNINVEEQVKLARKVLEEQRDGWYSILSLFGSAFDPSPEEDHPLTWAGRLRLSTAIPDASNAGTIDYAGQEMESKDGPKNINLNIDVRNPLDRVTAGAKSGGLHTWLEMSQGQTFDLDFQILNPTDKDVRLLELWLNDINEGYLRFGGLTTQVNGRCRVAQNNYELFVSMASPMAKSLLALKADPPTRTDANLEGLWTGAKLSLETLKGLEFDM